MKLKNLKKVADMPKVSGAMKEYKNNPGSINAAAYAAVYKAKQMKSDIVVIEGNSYGHRVYHLALPGDSLKKFTASSKPAKVIVVNQKGEAYEATAEDIFKEHTNLIEKYLKV